MSNEVKTKEKVDMDPKYIIKLTVTLLFDLHGRGWRSGLGQQHYQGQDRSDHLGKDRDRYEGGHQR